MDFGTESSPLANFNVMTGARKINEFGIETYHLFIYFKATYDRINRNLLYMLMKEIRISIINKTGKNDDDKGKWCN